MRIIVTGATGKLGLHVVKHLSQRHKVLVAGRDRDKLATLFPEQTSVEFKQIDTLTGTADAIVHLAALNNDTANTHAEYTAINAELTVQLADSARRIGAHRFVYLSSIRAYAPSKTDSYGCSKKLGEEKLRAIDGLDIRIVRAAAVIDIGGSSILKKIDHMPALLKPIIFAVASCVKPTAELADVFAAIDTALIGSGPSLHYATKRQRNNKAYAAIKRSIDLIGAGVLFLLTFWLFPLIAIAIRVTDGPPIMFRQTRLGEQEAPFELYKFRTMRIGTPNVGTAEAPQDAVTKLGRVLRRLKLDELPQIINVVRGNLSLIGPRPGLPNQTTLAEERRQLGVFEVMPGLTGLSQLSGLDMSEPQKLAERDAEYIALRTTAFDLSIAFRTIALIFKRR
ncbi:MAG: hybrid nucleoside-diphosphate sugar epimerase/sugar transferase [Pseudomonadota bacterium]